MDGVFGGSRNLFQPLRFCPSPCLLFLFAGREGPGKPFRREGNPADIENRCAGQCWIFDGAPVCWRGSKRRGVWLAELLPRLQVVLGSVLIILGIFWLSGSSFLSFSGPTKIKNSQKSFYLFGLLYGLGGISCMFPVFFSITFEATALGGFLSGILVFLAYGLGLGAMMFSITAILVLSKVFIFNKLIRATHYI